MSDIVERLLEPDRHDPKCPFKNHCYCDGDAHHDTVSHPLAAEAAETILALRTSLEMAAERFQEITQITAGCATSHGDDGGGLQMSNAVASEGWNFATAALATEAE